MKKSKFVKINLKEIDLSKRTKENHHPDIVVDTKLYLAKVDGQYATGHFNEQWYGLNFTGFYLAGLQFDEHSGWEQLWEIIEIPDKIRSLMKKIYK
jgi:hypothetical protein